MWSSLVLLALPIAFDPVRLGFNVLLISRPRPAQNLLVYWIGCALAGVVLLLVPILALHFTPTLSSFVHDLANPATSASSTVRHVEIAAGVLVVLVAALLAVRFLARQGAQTAARDANTSPHPIERPLSRGKDDQDAAPEGGSRAAIRRLLSRATDAWESESLWIALAVGLWAAPNPALVVFGLATIPTSGAAIGTQIGAAIVFVVETLAIVEIVLLSNLFAPTKTEASLRRLHDWARCYRRQILVVMLTFVGLALVAQGMGMI